VGSSQCAAYVDFFERIKSLSLVGNSNVKAAVFFDTVEEWGRFRDSDVWRNKSGVLLLLLLLLLLLDSSTVTYPIERFLPLWSATHSFT
jgi:hypothetical protein